MPKESQQEAMDRLRKAVAEEKDALAAARAALQGAAQQVRDNIDDTDALNELADSLESDDLPDAIVSGTNADPAAGSPSATNVGNEQGLDPHSREGAAAAGGYDAPAGQQTSTLDDASASASPAAGSVVADTDAAAAADGDTTDADDGDRITSQEGREAAGAFTGTGNQDAMRTSGRLGATDAHAADTRTVEEGADERTQDQSSSDAGSDTASCDTGSDEEGQAADSADSTDAQASAGDGSGNAA